MEELAFNAQRLGYEVKHMWRHKFCVPVMYVHDTVIKFNVKHSN